MSKFIIDDDVKTKLPNLSFWGIPITDVEVTKPLQFVKSKKKKVLSEFRNKYTLENIKSVPQVEAVRELFKMIGVDPDSEPTAVENLTVLVYKGGLPNINSVVDSCNIASLGTLMPIGAFDMDSIQGDLQLRLSSSGEKYSPIGMDDITLEDGILVLADDKGIIARPIYKDSKRTMITNQTKNVYIFTAQYPPITDNDVEFALNLAKDFVTTSSKGLAGEMFTFD
jgi:DNA/RNA-binding domain of Phe-tRNA-synthetase-like protein